MVQSDYETPTEKVGREGGSMRRWSLHRRGKVWYCQLADMEAGRYLPAKSTGCESKDDALLEVARWLREGIPSGRRREARPALEVFTLDRILAGIRSEEFRAEDAGKILEALRSRGFLEGGALRGSPGAEKLATFLERFWDYDESPYIKEKLAHGHRIGRAHSHESQNRILKHWKPYFGDKLLSEITRTELRNFATALADPSKKLAPATRNRILVAGTSAMRWAYENEMITEDITQGVMAFSGEAKKRGILDADEVEALFTLQWADERARIGNLTAATTGLRSGEVIALRLGDIEEGWLRVDHSWNATDGLKSPKNGEARRVPILPALRDALLALAKSNPHDCGEEGFVFYGTAPDKPANGRFLLDGLDDALVRLSLGAKYKDATEEERDTARGEWKERGIVFHSWRHFYSAQLASRIDGRKVSRATGHKSMSVFEHYAAHELDADLAAVRGASEAAFGNVVKFKKASGGER